MIKPSPHVAPHVQGEITETTGIVQLGGHKDIRAFGLGLLGTGRSLSI